MSRCMAYISSGSLVSKRVRREDVGEGVRGSRERRFMRCSSSYGMSIMTKVGMLALVDSTSWVIFCKHALPVLQMWTAKWVSRCVSAGRGRTTFAGNGQHRLDIVVHFARRRLADSKVALSYIASRGSRDERLGQRLLPHVLVVGPPVNVDNIARAMFHCLRLCAATRQHWSPAQRGGCWGGVAKWGGRVVAVRRLNGSDSVTGECEAEAWWMGCSRGPIGGRERSGSGHRRAADRVERPEAWGSAEMGRRECAGWSEMHSETTTSVEAPGNPARRRAAASAHDTRVQCLLYTRKAQRVDATRKAGSDVGGQARRRAGAGRGCLLVSLTRRARNGTCRDSSSAAGVLRRWLAACLGSVLSVFRARVRVVDACRGSSGPRCVA